MLDARTLPVIPELWLSEAKYWQETSFSWKRWENPFHPGGHDHCGFCWACICNHRELFPHEKEEHLIRGCYGHAYYNVRTDGTDIWVCRTCFNRIAPEAGWTLRKAGR